MEITGPIFCDVFFGERLMLSYVDLKVVMNRYSDEFVLMSPMEVADLKKKLVYVYIKFAKSN